MDRWRTILWVLLVTGVGAVLRLVASGTVPPGLYHDEAFNGLDALRVLAGEHPVYFTANNGREPLFIYLASMSVAMLGRTPAAIRLPAALLGTLTIVASAALGSSLFNRRVGLLASVVVAITFWPLHLSRVAFRAVGLPLVVALALAASWHGVKQRKRGWVFAGGLLYGLAFYTYLPIYFTLPILALFGIYLWATGHKAQLRFAVPWFALAATIAAAPLAITAVSDPSLLFGRTGQVSVLSPVVNEGDLWGTLWRHVGRGLGMFFWRGDTIPRHNLPGRPVFDLFMAPFFLVGVVWAGWNWRRPAAAFALLWTLLMLAPTVLAEDAPHFLRGSGVLPMACLLPAVGLDQSRGWLAQRLRRRWLPLALTGLILIASLGLTVWDYFGEYATDPLTGYAFQDAAVELAEQINRFDGAVWASQRFEREWQAIPFLTGDRGVHWLLDGETALTTALPAALFLWPYEPVSPRLAALPMGVSLQGWRGPLTKGDLELTAYPLYWGYWLDTRPERPDEPVARFEGGVRLEGAAVTLCEGRSTAAPVGTGACVTPAFPGVPSSGGEGGCPPGRAAPATDAGRGDEPALQVVLCWTAEEGLEADYIAFVHVAGEAGIVAQDDSVPGAGTLPTGWWRPSDWIVDTHIIPMPSRFDPSIHEVLVGLYRSDNRERVALVDPVGRVVGDAVALFEDGAPGT